MDVKKRIAECLEEIKMWMVKNCMKLNERKTELLVFGKPLTVKTLDADFSIRFGDSVISRSSWKGDEGKSLGVVLDASLTMDRQIADVKKRCSWTMMNLRTIGRYLDENIKIMLVKQLVISKLDYCNALYMNITKKRLKKLGSVLNTSIRFIYNINDRCEDLIPYYKKAHILPIQQRILYKVCLMIQKVIHGNSPNYIRELVELDCPSTLTRSKVAGDPKTMDNFKLKQPRMTKTKIEDRCFSNYAPAEWNKLPLSIRCIDSVTEFKKKLKHYFYDLI